MHWMGYTERKPSNGMHGTEETMIIQRDRYLQQLQKKRGNGLIKVITGLRRCGKTYLLKKIYRDWLIEHGVPEDHIIYLALDQTENIRYRNPFELDRYIKDRIGKGGTGAAAGADYVVMIDEIQFSVPVPNPYLPESEQDKSNAITFYDVVLGLMDQCDLYITGSNSEMLSSDILTNFRGRGDEIRIYPLSFAEYFAVVGGSERSAFLDYLRYGGMPLILSQRTPSEKADYLQSLFDKIYLTDIVERYKVRDLDALGKVTDYLASSMGSLTNPTNIAGRFQDKTIARNTVADYIHYLHNSYLISEAARFDVRGREYIQGQQKYYFTDPGLRNARLNFRQFDLPHLLENVVYNELITRGYHVDIGRVQVNEKKADGKYQTVNLESDFIINDMDRRMYIQVTEGLDDPDKKEQEMRSLLHIRDGFPKMVLVNEDVPEYHTEDGIIIKSIREFLLHP